MSRARELRVLVPFAAFALVGCTVLSAGAQATLPATPPTGLGQAGAMAPIAAPGTSADRPGARRHRAQVSCANGMLAVRADNSSLNGILRSISSCTGMRVTGGVVDQRVYGNYGPAAPATVLATLLDGTGSNMLLQETASDQPAELILTPRTGGPTPPSPSSVADEDASADPAEGNGPAANGMARTGGMASGNNAGSMTSPGNGQSRNGQSSGGQGSNGQTSYASPVNPNQTPVPQPVTGSAVTGPSPIPQPINNVNGSPNNTSPTASTYPTTNSVPIDTLPTPSTTPSTSGIVDAPNPPAAGSDTEKLLQGVNSNNPGTTNISPGATSADTTPGATGTTTPAAPDAGQPAANGSGGGAMTPEQVYQQLQQMRARQQQTQQPQTPTAPAPQ